jgi:hypothetical protein
MRFSISNLSTGETQRSRCYVASALAGLLVLCVGCGTEAAPSTARPAPASAQPSASAAPVPPAATPSTAAPPASASALATSDNDGGTGRAEIVELKRIPGDMLMLRTAFVSTGREPMSMATTYTDPRTGDVYNVGGITLVDPVNKKKYFVVRDSGNNCVCSEGLKDVKPGERIMAWARFPGPPEDVQKLSVLIPHFPPMDEVAVAK